jgi:hypothetical protein
MCLLKLEKFAELLQNAVTSENDALNVIYAQFIKIRLKQLKLENQNRYRMWGVPN